VLRVTMVRSCCKLVAARRLSMTGNGSVTPLGLAHQKAPALSDPNVDWKNPTSKSLREITAHPVNELGFSDQVPRPSKVITCEPSSRALRTTSESRFLASWSCQRVVVY
jgi:hypothetical protein